MIGDWVRGTADLDTEWYGWQIAPGECIQVRSILHTGINYESNGIAPSFEDDTIRFDDIEPIPITEEILEKNGWSPVTHSFEELGCYVKRMGESDWFRFECGEYGWPVHNVHELQHALLLFGSTEDFII